MPHEDVESQQYSSRKAILAIVAGLAHALAFAPLGWYAAGILSMAGLFGLWRNVTPLHAARLGLLYGLAFSASTTYWLPIGLLSVMPESKAVGVGTFLFAWFYCAAPWAVAGWAQARLGCLVASWRLLVVVPTVLTLGTWVNTWLFGGLPWMAPAYGQVEGVLASAFPVGGFLLVSLLAILTSSLLVHCWLFRWKSWGSAAGLFAIFATCAALLQVNWTVTTGQQLKVGIIQSNAPAQLNGDEAQVANYALHLRATRKLMQRHQPDVVVWSEGALTGSRSELSEFMQRHLKNELEGAAFLVGLIDTKIAASELKNLPANSSTVPRFNTVAALGFQTAGSYQKRHLMPVGEYLPEAGPMGWVRRQMGPQRVWTTPGPHKQSSLVVRGELVAASICYEDVFSKVFAGHDPAVAWLLNLTSDAWFATSTQPWQHLALSRARAMEYGRYLVRAANIGPSAIIDARGRVMAVSAADQPAMLLGEIVLMQGLTPYARWGDGLVLCLIFALLVAVMVRLKVHNKVNVVVIT